MQTFAVLLVLGFSAFTTAQDENNKPDNGNDYLDNILKNLRVKIIEEGLDPVMLPLKSFEFTRKILFLEIIGTAKVYDGYLGGISDIHRTGNAAMNMNENKTKVNIHATIGVNDLVGHYKAAAKFMKIGPQFTLKINVESVGINFEIESKLEKGARAKLLKFHVVDLGRVTAEVDGPIPILFWLVNKVINFVISWVKLIVVSVLENPIKNKLQLMLQSSNNIPDLATILEKNKPKHSPHIRIN